MPQTKDYPLTKLMGLLQQAASPEDFDQFCNFNAVGVELFCEVHGTQMHIYPKVQEMVHDEAMNFPVEDYLTGVSEDSSDSIFFEADCSDLRFMIDTFFKKEVDFHPDGMETTARRFFLRNMEDMYGLVHEKSNGEKTYSLLLNFYCYNTHREVEVTILDITGDLTDGATIIHSTSLVERRPTFSELAEEAMAASAT